MQTLLRKCDSDIFSKHRLIALLYFTDGKAKKYKDTSNSKEQNGEFSL